MAGIVGEGAHVGGADVQEMRGIAGGIGEAATQLGARFHDRDAHAARFAPQQMGRHQGAAGAAADDDDPEREKVRHGGLIQQIRHASLNLRLHIL